MDTNRNLIFAEDDFDEIYEKYFTSLPSWESLEADISYWHNTMPKTLEYLNFDKETKYYRSDYSKELLADKRKILNGLSCWENDGIDCDELTLCTSATIASLIVLSFLKRKGIRKIVFETPCYFASIYQAKLLDFEVILVPTYYKDNYNLAIPQELLVDSVSKTIWLTQPKFAIGSNQSSCEIKKLYSKLSDKDFLVVDEANEHMFPSVLHELRTRDMHNLIKFRSLFKPLGLNGPRISCIFHNTIYRDTFQDIMDIMQGGIDYKSVSLATNLYDNPPKLKMLLDIVHEQIMELRYQAENLCRYTRLEISPIENGYLGSVHIRFESDKPHEQQRKDLLNFCHQVKLPIILGSSMYYAIEPFVEHVRLNYFIHNSLFINGLKLLISKYKL